MVPWWGGKQRKRKTMRAFPPVIWTKLSFATKSSKEQLGGPDEAFFEHLGQADVISVPVVAPRTSSAKSRVPRPRRVPEHSTAPVFDVLINFQGRVTLSGPVLRETPSSIRFSRRSSIGSSFGGSGRYILNSHCALKSALNEILAHLIGRGLAYRGTGSVVWSMTGRGSFGWESALADESN